MNVEGSKVIVAGTFEGVDVKAVRGKLEEQGALLVDEVSPDVAVVFAGGGVDRLAAGAMELGVQVHGAEALVAWLESGELPKLEVAAPYEEPMFFADDAVPDYVTYEEAPEPVDWASPSEGATGRGFDKGVTVKIVGGTDGVGVVGEIFWWGNSKYGEGMRAGVRGPGEEETYWVDEEHLGWPDDEVPFHVQELAQKASAFKRGDHVRIIAGKDQGAEGTIFWWGESKWGPGMRAGIETTDGGKAWVDAEELELAGEALIGPSGSGGSGGGFSDDEIPF
ncbi:MAG: hypothetical protein AAGI01_02685 [Myxococcota bacterium]